MKVREGSVKGSVKLFSACSKTIVNVKVREGSVKGSVKLFSACLKNNVNVKVREGSVKGSVKGFARLVKFSPILVFFSVQAKRDHGSTIIAES